MSGELLAIVHAEERAAAIVADAEKRTMKYAERARRDREQKLSALKQPETRKVRVSHKTPDETHIRGVARKNMNAAVKKILEEIYAT